MKKNISPACSLLLLPLFTPCFALSMEKEGQNPMAESVIVIPEPKKRGLGVLRTLKNNSPSFLGWTQEENLYNDLKDKTFDTENSSYHHQLDTAIQIYVSKQNSQRVTEILALCRQNYPKQVKIGDGQAVMAHKLLTEDNKTKQTNLKKALEAKDKEFIEQENILLTQLKKTLTAHITEMRKLSLTYLGDPQKEECLGERNTYVKQECNEIRNLKTGLVNIHKLNKEFSLPKDIKDGYCSDDEKDIKNPANIQNSYNDAHILEKIEITDKMNQTKTKISDLLCSLVDLESKLNALKSLEY